MLTAINCFFDERPQPGAYGFGREWFLNELQASDPLRFRKAVELIIRDERVTTLGPATTRTLIQAVGGYLGRELADKDQIRDSTHRRRRRATGSSSILRTGIAALRKRWMNGQDRTHPLLPANNGDMHGSYPCCRLGS